MDQALQVQKIQTQGDVPPARFGHTLQQVSSNQAVLFGGAIGDNNKFIITNDTFVYNMNTQYWKRLNLPSAPSQRAAHATCAIDRDIMVVYGGAASGGGGLSTDDLHQLDVKNEKWSIVPTSGRTPGKRYGHCMIFFKPFIIVFGGNTGTVPVNDTWIMNIENRIWQNLEFQGDVPCVRVYHGAGLCQTGSANGMMVIFGGRTIDQNPLNDCWGLRRHRDGKWDWVQAPYKQEQPICRYQHWITFIGPLMIVLGGRSNASEEQASMLEIYDTESSDWYKFNAINRYRHTILSINNLLYVHGGFEPEYPNKPLDNFLLLDLARIGYHYPKLQKTLNPNQGILQESFQNSQNSLKQTGNQQMYKQISNRDTTPLKRSQQHNENATKNIRISNQAVVATIQNPGEEQFQNIKKVPVKSLAEESKKLSQNFYDPNINLCSSNMEQLSQIFIQHLIKGKNFKQNDMRIPFKKELILRLCDEVLKTVKNQSNVPKLRVAVKIFGSLHGKFNELLRFFENFGYPHDEEGGDVEKFDYLFLGNYVDRGFNSIETICALFALKIKYPDHIHMIRGRHDDIKVNKLFGFGEECSLRLNEDINDMNSVFRRVNEVFSWLPLAAVIENKILCVNGGIGKNLQYLDQIEDIERPINIWQEITQVAHEVLYSEYSSQTDGLMENKGKDIFNIGQSYKFGENKLKKFLHENGLSLMITSSECVQEGFERNQSGLLLNVFSVPDYGGRFQNNGTMIKIKKNFEIVPCTLTPQSGHKKQNWLNMENTIKTTINFTDEELRVKKRQLTPPKTQKQTKIL